MRRERRAMAEGLRVVRGCANFVLVFAPPPLRAAELIRRCAASGVFLRDASIMWADGEGAPAGVEGAVRIAIKSPRENAAILAAVTAACKQ